MHVMVYLQLSVWNDMSDPFLLKYKKPMISVLSLLNDSIRKISYKALSKEDMELFDSVINQWRESNKDQFHVAFIRFDDFNTSVEKDKLLKNIARNGLFISIESAAKNLREIEQLSERALFLANRMPILIRWQTELFAYRMASTDEFINFGGNMDSFRSSVEMISNTFASIPQELDTQKSDFLRELSSEIQEQ